MNQNKPLEHPGLRLARYLKEFVGLRTTTVRDVAKYDTVMWFGDMPQEPDCRSGAWFDEQEPNAPWLEVRKQKFEPPPLPPEIVLPWLDDKAIKRAAVEIPPLKSTIFAPDPNAQLEEGEEAPLIELSVEDHPEVQNAYDRYKPAWEAWSKEYRRRESIQKVYAELFRLHTQLRKQGEIVEIVLGMGLLDWRAKLNEKLIPVRRHVAVANVEIDFDPAKGVIRVVAPGDGARLRLEDDMLEAELRPDRSHYDAVKMQLDEISDDIWDKAQIHTALKTWMGSLSADLQWSSMLGHQVQDNKGQSLIFAPALIMRTRPQTAMVRIYDAIIDQLSSHTPDIPRGWQGLTEDIGDSEIIIDAESDGMPEIDKPTAANADVYFPFPTNREQRHIVEAIDHNRGVLVQGPPGTGKSHTIRNLICHLLATGKRILVTAETARALRVLKDGLPEDIKPLCVSLLGQGGDAFSELNKAVQGITTRQASYTPGAYDVRIREIDNELDMARRHLAKTDTEILSLREDETSKSVVANGAYQGTASAIAARVASEKEKYGWLKIPREFRPEPPLATSELLEWLSILRKYTGEQISQARLRIPPSQEVPSPNEFGDLVAIEIESKLALARKQALRSHSAYAAIQALNPTARSKVADELRDIERKHLALERIKDNWLQIAIKDLMEHRKARWETLIVLTKSGIAKVEILINRLGPRIVTIPDNYDLHKVRVDAEAAIGHLNKGMQWKRLVLFTPKVLKDYVYLKENIRIDGVEAADSEQLQVVCDYLDIEFTLSDLKSAWNEVEAVSTSNDKRLVVAVLKEQLSALEQGLEYVNACHGLADEMARATPPIPEPDWMNGGVQKWLELIDAAVFEDKHREAVSRINGDTKILVGLRDLHDLHSAARSLITAADARDVKGYSEAFAQITSIEATRADQERRTRVEEVINKTVPGLVDNITADVNDPVWGERLADWDKAWFWAIADVWLDMRSDFSYQQELWRRRHEIDKKIGRLLAEAAALRAWTHFFNRLSSREAAALKSWREAVRAMGKGTGKSDKMARLRQEARQYMDSCRDAIPVWIMPRYLVAEMVNPGPGRYDFIIVDEASQLGIESLFLFYITKKMVVVGDDQQISPYGVGIADEAIAGLQHHYLTGIPHRHALSAQSSLYANAKIRFGQNIVLREHFRCMPEIIQFSNDLCYASNGTPLDPLRAYPANRLKPLVLHHVTDGYRTGSTQHVQNPPEADAVVAQIAACIEDTRYAGKSMGVISLQGEAQAKLIERKLLDHLEPEVIEERKLICGDAYAFQGDERDIIFLSMVAAPGETRIGVLANEAARQRFNVAVSRARDQLWLFHSVTLDVLSDQCMRYRLLSYMLDPARQTTIEKEQHFDSEFEREVYRLLTDKGFHVRTQVCIGDPTNHRYRIDLVVEGMQGRLAVECDGDQWHGPDRYEHDMARQRDLERAGWQFVRIRGGDFYRDPAWAMEPVWAELERLDIKPGGIDEAAAELPPPLDLESLNGINEIEAVPENNEPLLAATESPPEKYTLDRTLGTVDFGDGEHGRRLPEEGQQEIQSSDRHGTTADPAINPTQQLVSGPHADYVPFTGKAGPDPRHASPLSVADGLCQIIKVALRKN